MAQKKQKKKRIKKEIIRKYGRCAQPPVDMHTHSAEAERNHSMGERGKQRSIDRHKRAKGVGVTYHHMQGVPFCSLHMRLEHVPCFGVITERSLMLEEPCCEVELYIAVIFESDHS